MILRLAIGVLLVAALAHAADYSWTAPESGGWSVPSNWGTAQAPNSPDANATLAVTGVPYTVGLGVSIELHNLAIASADATLAHTAGTMMLHGTATLTAGRYYLNGGTISGGTIEQAGGVLDFGAAPGNTLDGVTVKGGIAIAQEDGSVRFINNSVFTGNAILDGTSNTIAFGENATLDDQTVHLNGAGSRLRADGDWTVNIGGNGAIYLRGDGSAIDSTAGFGTVRNDGRIIADGTSNTIFITPENFENAGRVEVRNGSLAQIGDGTSNAVLFGESVVDVQDGSVRFVGNWSNAGTIELQNADCELGGTFQTSQIGTIVRDGTSNTILVGEAVNTGNTWDLAATTGDLVLGDCTITGGTVQQSENARLIFDDGSVRFINHSVIEGGLAVAGSDGSVRFINNGVFRGNAVVDGASNTILFGEEVTLNDQEFHLNGEGNQLAVDGNYTVTLGADAKVCLRGEGTRLADNIYTTANPVFVNYGLIEAEGAGTRSIELQDFRNHGEIRIADQAVVEIGNGTSNTTLGSGSRVILENGSVRFVSETINEGMIEADSSSVEISGSFVQNDGSVRFVKTTVIVADGATATIAGGEFGGSGSVLGDITFTGGSIVPGDMSINGDLELSANVRMVFELRGTAQGTEYGFLSAAGSVALNLDGVILEVSLGDGFVPLSTDTFTILVSNETLDGTFANVADGGILEVNGGSFTVTYLGLDSVVLSDFAAVPEPSIVFLLAVAAVTLLARCFRQHRE